MANIQNKNIDLLQAYKSKAEKQGVPTWVKYSILPLVLVIVFASIFTYQMVQANSYQKEIDKYTKQYDQVQAKMKKENATETLALMSEVETRASNLSSVVSNLATYPRISREIFAQILAAGQGTLELQGVVFDDKTGALVITATTYDVNQPAAYVQRLKDTQAFVDVLYDGYTETQETSTTVSDMVNEVINGESTEKTEDTTKETVTTLRTKYQVIVSCFLKAGGQ